MTRRLQETTHFKRATRFSKLMECFSKNTFIMGDQINKVDGVTFGLMLL